ncbi:hypothetical protein AGMMS49975_02280 [Clostridia bacterium]|nr:hypothetical protein AGMMS49975_02280 [Clostridia bacterium]
MKSAVYAIFAAFVTIAFLQPLIETANLLTEKVRLDSALLNSCRAARYNSLVDERMRDLNAEIEEDIFKEYFAEAFSQTLKLNILSPESGKMAFSSSHGGRYEKITVALSISPSEDFGGRSVAVAELDLSTPYVFQTALLRRVASGSAYQINERRLFKIQVVN